MELTKVFCIGLNKTGTKSFGRAMQTLGYTSLPWSPKPLVAYMNRDQVTLNRLIDKHNCFDDWPWPLMARELMGSLPSAKFVITRRRNAEVWLDSIKRHALKTPSARMIRRFIFGHSDPFDHESSYLEYYENHYAKLERNVIELGCKDRVLSVCWEEGHGWSEICNFLELPVPSEAFPHLNKSKEI